MDNLPDTPTKSEEDEALDPRVQVELERLNYANEAINHLELQLDEARKTLKEFHLMSEQDLFQLEKSIGTAVSKAKCYYDARIKLRDTKEMLTKAQHRFERAQALHLAAKELALVSRDRIDEAEESDEKNIALWNETYRQALAKSGDAEREKYQADIDQQRAEKVYLEMQSLVEKFQKDYRRSINKSKPYYEKKAEYHKELDFHKRKVCGLENCVNEAKTQYQASLRALENISNEIHEQRNHDKIQRESTTTITTTTTTTEEQLTYTETIPRKNSDAIVRSCLLRTESLPTGIFTTTNNIETHHDQFILCSNQTTLITNSEKDINHFIEQMRERVPSFSSQMTDDDHTESLRVLNDEQIDHLASAYHDYPSDLPSYSGMTDNSSKQSNNVLSDAFLY